MPTCFDTSFGLTCGGLALVAILFIVWAAVTVLQISMWPRINTSRRWRFAMLGGTLAISLAHQVMFSTLADDAYISFRYSRNLAEGNGLVFNVGEKVEGYSNFLWVVLVAIPHALFSADIVLTARLLGIGCALVAVVLAYVLATRISGSGAAGVLAATIAAVSGSFAAYGPSGLETPLFALLVLGALLAVQWNRAIVAGLLVALATMTRPDGVVIAMVIGLWFLFWAVRRNSGWWPVVSYVASAMVLVVPWTIWRIQYYGHLLPNAIAAKSGASLRWQLEVGWEYLMGFAGAAQALLVFVPVAMFVLVTRRTQIEERARDMVWLLFGLAIVYLAFFTATGGDWMPAWRFFAPAVPLLGVAVCAVWAFAGPDARQVPAPEETEEATAPARSPSRLGPVLVAGIGLMLLTVSAYGARMKPIIDEWNGDVHELAEIGVWARDTLPDGTVISTYANGALSYEAGPKLTVVDQLGLTDEHIARAGKRIPVGGVIGHTAHDYEYIANVRKPDVVFMTGTGYLHSVPCSVPAELGEKYVAAPFQVAGEPLWIPALVRKETASWVIPTLSKDPRYRPATCPSPST
jgi:arabinofuranosyltransferase